MSHKNYSWIAFLLLPFLSFAQLTVTPNSTANALAQTIAGNGVTVSNAAINCGAGASGTFSYSGGNLGINSGIILTTGSAADAANPGSYFADVLNGNTYTDPNLTSIEPAATNDVCILEFDFVPICNSISITYVFGSEEYPNFVNSSYNDGFGIFLTGPNPGGGNYNATNIGTLPNGTAVSINNVNASTNPGYFHNNYTTPNNDIAYDGYTIPVTSTTSVTPCSTYHMKIAIADAGDEAYDSGVFVGSDAVTCQNAPSVTASATPTGCGGNTGSATATVTNYTGTITYQWQPGGQTSATINNLPTGTYTCNVGLQMGCGTITQTVTATVSNVGVTLNLTPSSTNPSCTGSTNGTASVSVNGGSAPYSFSWNTTPVQTTQGISGLGSGSYVVTVTDNGGCSGTTTVTLTNPAPIVANVTTAPTTCSANNGTASANVTSGGTGPYSYAWSTTPIQTTQVATGLAAGTYTVIIADANSCTVTASGAVTQQNGGWTLSVPTATNVSCFSGTNGVTSFTVNNPGANTYTYAWNTTPVQTTSTASNLPAGSYTCQVTDNNGCSQTVSATITQPVQVTANTNTSPTNCSGAIGSATVTAAGGTAPYSYAWSTTPVQITAAASNLAAGTYTVVVADANSCTVTATAVVSSSAQNINANTNSAPTICTGSVGSATVTPSGGTTPYTYSWSTTPVQTTATATHLAAGTYTVTITDGNGCSTTATAVVGTTIQSMTASSSVTPSQCGSPDGGVTMSNVSGGTSPYTYSWNSTPVQTTMNLVNVSPGNYTLTIIDQNGCISSFPQTVGMTNNLPLAIAGTSDICNSSLGSATVTASGAGPFTYFWNTNPPQTTQTISNLPAGNYFVVVQDNFGCADSISVNVGNVNELLSSSFFINPDEIYSGEPATITVSMNSGWMLDSAYLTDGNLWFATNSLTHTFNQYGTYYAEYFFTSVHGCRDSVIYPIKVTDYMTLYFPNAFSPNGDGLNDVFKASGTFIENFEMFIYDRWGQLVLKTTDINKGWDGTYKSDDAVQDTYVYKGKASDAFGHKVNFQGQINLVR